MGVNISASTLLNQLNLTGTYSYSTTKTTKTLNEHKLSTRDCCENFKRSLRKLKKLDITNSGDKLKAKKNIKQIISDYNELCEAASSIDSRDYSRAVSKLEDIMDKYSDDLKDLGIKKSESGKLSFDNVKWNALEQDKLTESYNYIFNKDSDFILGIEK